MGYTGRLRYRKLQRTRTVPMRHEHSPSISISAFPFLFLKKLITLCHKFRAWVICRRYLCKQFPWPRRFRRGPLTLHLEWGEGGGLCSPYLAPPQPPPEELGFYLTFFMLGFRLLLFPTKRFWEKKFNYWSILILSF